MPPRRLLNRNQVLDVLNIPDADLQALVDTNQLIEIILRGHQLYDSRDIDALVDTYKQLARRRTDTHDEHGL